MKKSQLKSEDHSSAENEKLKKISKELNKASKMHKGQADNIAKITNETNDLEDDAEQAEYDKGWYGESLKDIASKLGYLKEESNFNSQYNDLAQEEFGLDYSELNSSDAEWIRYEVDNEGYLEENILPISLQQLENEINKIAGEKSSIFETRSGIYKIKFSYVKQEFEASKWSEILKHIEEHPNDYNIIDQSNHYEYGRELEELYVPYITFK